ncbi:extracellular nuclease [Rhodopirellula maiorica SM1]|uniref:Extracellular nuclease n=1 Tax=Rhodopirellula maiorica SM1 TaxID=1265738 RepID=M5RT78_9BACT|nr:extracellular nuclease [Rhodopirellula maiorica SM1]
MDSTISANSATNEGGGLWNSGEGTLAVTRSTVSGNISADGGGIFNDGTSGDITITNSTIAANTATINGGGINSEGADVTLTSVTIAGNTAVIGGGIYTLGGVFSTTNTLVANNNATTGTDASGSITSGGNNLLGNSAGVTLSGSLQTNITDVDALLDMLGDNGGPTHTIALLQGSPALNSGVAAGLTVDQRGVARPQGTGFDIGAFESNLNGTVDPAVLSIAAADAIKNEGSSGLTPFTFTVTRTGNTAGVTTVNYVVTGTGNNPASANDFEDGDLPDGVVRFAAGESSKTITVNINGDTTIENNENFRVTLSNASGDASIVTATADGIVLDDDRPPTVPRVVIPNQVEGGQPVPGDGTTTAILFQALIDTVVTVTPVGTASLSETILIFDTDAMIVSNMIGTLATASLEAGGVYAIVFEPQFVDRVFAIRTSTGPGSLSNAPPTNIVQPTDTNASGETTAMDALLVINSLNRIGGGEGEQTIPRFLDVNRDNKVTALDALRIINQLSRASVNTADIVVTADSLPPLLPTTTSNNEPDTAASDDAVDTLFGETSSESLLVRSSATNDSSPSPSTIHLDAVDEAMEEEEFAPSSQLDDSLIALLS